MDYAMQQGGLTDAQFKIMQDNLFVKETGWVRHGT
jgi:hypothetical protein